MVSSRPSGHRMATAPPQPDACISDEEAIALLEKRLAPATRTRIDRHLDGCDACRELVGALALAQEGSSASIPAAPPPARGRPAIYEGSTAADSSVTAYSMGAPAASLDGSYFGRGHEVGHFRVMRLLGRGSMGEVYLARDTQLGRKVALKIIAANLVKSNRAMQRFLFEARATARFNHPSIVTIHEVGEYDQRPFLALEYVEGENLKARLETERPALRETLRIGLSVAEALQEAHRHGILHRDLKPANVVIGTDGRVRVVDFGLSKAVQPSDEDGVRNPAISTAAMLVGTPRYMSPEQWESSDCTSAADIWALGVILFELCAGRRPYELSSAVDLLNAVTGADPAPRLSEFVAVPQQLVELVAACLAKAPAQRPDASEVADMLRGMLYPERPAAPAADAPFRGLLPFGERHANMFFGRDAEIAAFIERLRSQPISPLVGPSGAGKSSFVMAGVIPRLREQEGWLVLTVRPGPRPFDTLAASLERGDPGVVTGRPSIADSRQLPSYRQVEARSRELQASPRRLAMELRELAELKQAKVLLFVDQMEEVFTMGEEPAVQELFLRSLAHAADDRDDPVRVVLALRHDFIDRLSLAGDVSLQWGHFTVLRAPDVDGLRQILRQPVERAGYRFEDEGLVDQMISAVYGEPACLPLLQFAAAQLWQFRDQARQLILRQTYEAMGGVGGALARHADAILDGLSARSRELCRELLLRLVTGEKTRRVVPRSRALDGLGPEGESVLKDLTEARLVNVTKLQRGDEPMLELAHESLIHTWGTLAHWIEHAGDELRFVTEASQAAELWDKRGRRLEELWQGEALYDAERRLEHASTEVPPLVQNFLQASRQAERGRHRRRRYVLVGAVVALAMIAAGATVAALVIASQQRDAQLARQRAEHHERTANHERAHNLLEAARAAASTDPLGARARLRLALEIEDSAAARALWQTLQGMPLQHRLPLRTGSNDVAFSPQRDQLAIASHDRTIYVTSLATGTVRPLRGHQDAVTAVAYADHDTVVSADRAGAILRWDLTQSPARPKRIAEVTGGPTRVAVRRGRVLVGSRRLTLVDGQKARSLDGGGTEAVVDVAMAGDRLFAARGDQLEVRGADGKLERRLSATGPIRALAIAPDGQTIATASRDGTIELWQPDAEDPKRRLSGPASGVSSLAVAPGGDQLAGASGRHVRVWNLATGRLVRKFQVAGNVRRLRFDREGQFLVAAAEGDVRVWDVTRRTQDLVRGHRGPVHDVHISTDAKRVASAGTDGTVRLWERDSGREHHVLQGHGDAVHRARFSPDGQRLASASADGTVRLWEVRTGAEDRILGGHVGPVTALTYAPDGDELATGGVDRTVRRWNLRTDGVTVSTGPTTPITHLSFDASGRRLAVFTQSGMWRWQGGRGERLPAQATLGAFMGNDLVTVRRDGTVNRLDDGWRPEVTGVRALAAREKLLAVGRVDGTVEIYDAGKDRPRLRLPGHRGGVNALTLRGELLASAGDDGTVRLYDLVSGRPAWRGIALMLDPPHVVSHRGWRPLAGRHARKELKGPGTRWARAVDAARFATHLPGGPLCLATGEEIEIWDRRDDRRLAHHGLRGQLVALPTGCAVRTRDAKVYVLDRAGGSTAIKIDERAIAMGWGEERLLVATGREVRAFAESGELLGAHPNDNDGVVALTQIGSQLVVGRVEGSIALVATAEAEPSAIARFERATGGAVVRMVPGPWKTLVTGYGDGTVALHDLDTGALLARAQLHGAALHLDVRGDALYAATDLGDSLRWPLAIFERDYCQLLQEVWTHVPVVWAQGQPTPKPAPGYHRCHP